MSSVQYYVTCGFFMQPKRTKLSTLHQKREIDWQQKKKNIYDKKCINVILFYFFF